jgi:hypothetical protein
VKFTWNLRDSLRLKTDADFDRGRWDPEKEPVVESCASTEPDPLIGKSEPGYNNEIQLFQMRAWSRFPDSKSPGHKFRERQDWAKSESVTFTPRIADQVMVKQAEVPQKIQVRFSRRWREQAEALLVGKEEVKLFADPKGSRVSFVLRQLTNSLAHRVP